MTTRYDYGLLEFTANLAEAEANYGQKLQSIIDTFSQSRLDLPLKKLCEIAKVHSRTAQNLKKHMDPKRNEHLNLWKLCNVYSCGAVDLDNAMRETRSSLRTKMAIDGTLIEKAKKRNIFNSLQSHLNPKSTTDNDNSGRKWFPKLSERKGESRSTRKNALPSLENSEKEDEDLSGSKTSPPPPPVRPHTNLQASASMAPEPKPPRPPTRPAIPEPPNSAPPPIPTLSAPISYATPIYGDLQKALNRSSNKNNKVGYVEEHPLHHTEYAPKELSVVRIRTDIDVSRESKLEGTTVNVYDSPPVIQNHYANIRPPIAQKPKLITSDGTKLVKAENDVSPTFISVDFYQSTIPVPSPRTCFNTNDIPSSQRSSSSAYSSNYSSTSNVTSLAVDNASTSIISQSHPEVVENARYVRVASPDGVLHRF